MWGGGLRADTWFRAVAIRIVLDGSRFAPESETAVRRFACDATLPATIFRGLWSLARKSFFDCRTSGRWEDRKSVV